jgi:hypothetical protein
LHPGAHQAIVSLTPAGRISTQAKLQNLPAREEVKTAFTRTSKYCLHARVNSLHSGAWVIKETSEYLCSPLLAPQRGMRLEIMIYYGFPMQEHHLSISARMITNPQVRQGLARRMRVDKLL